MKRQDYIEIIPMAILLILVVYSIIEVIITIYTFGIKQYAGLTLLGISMILFFFNRRTYRYFFGITLLLALFSLIGFTTSIITTKFFGIIPIQILLLPIVILFTWIHREQLKSKNLDIFGQQKQAKLGSSSKVNGFKRRFSKLSNNEIELKLGEKLIPEAIEALQQLKKEREERKG